MTVSFGFYNSLAGDRLYDATQFSSMFEGIITDGIFEMFGDAFEVTPNSGMDINVGVGKAWFNNTWTLNDTVLVLTVDAAEVALHRIDTVVVEINKNIAIRTNSIKIIKGTPASSPVPPTLSNSGNLYQYPFADIYVESGSTEVLAGDITTRIGTDTPFITGVIETGATEALQIEVDSVLHRYKIVPTLNPGTGALVVAIKYIDDNDPSAIRVLRFRVGNTEYTLEAAMSYSKATGTNWSNAGSTELAAQDIDYFLYAIGETGASAGLKFGHSRIPYATKMSDFVNTSTDFKYISGNWTNFNANDAVTVIGRFRARLSAGSSYTWSIPNEKIINRPIYRTDPLVWTTTVTSGGGSPTSLTKDTKYELYENFIKTWGNLLINDKGTATGSMKLTPPLTLPDGVGFGQEVVVTGVGGAVVTGGNLIYITKYDATTPWTNTYKWFFQHHINLA